MQTIGYTLLIWAAYAGIAVVACAPIIYLGRRRVHWRYWELLALVLPFCTWFVLALSGLSLSHGRVHFDEGKSLSNIVEAFWLGCSVPIAALLRVIIGTKLNEGICAKVIQTALCVVGGAVSVLTPCLPE